MARTQEVEVRQDELAGAREVARGFSRYVEELGDNNRRLVAVLHRNKLTAILLSADGFEILTELCEAATAWEEAMDGWEPEGGDSRLAAAQKRFAEARTAFLEWRAR